MNTLHNAAARAVAPHLKSSYTAGLNGYPLIVGADEDAAAAVVDLVLKDVRTVVLEECAGFFDAVRDRLDALAARDEA